MVTKPRYQAPALKKGLEILELLASADGAISMSDISAALGRSVSEIFRMLQVLEEHHYIVRDDSGYRLTNRLFALGMRQPPVRDLVSTALPVMHDLAWKTGQSCHLAVASGAEMVVITNVEAPGLVGFAVRVGYRRPLHLSTSGQVLLAFQPAARHAAMLADARETGEIIDEAALAQILAQIVADAGATSPSPMLTGIVDLAAPILASHAAIAALTVPFVDGPGARVALADTRDALHHAADEISHHMAPSVRSGATAPPG
ncbi:MULTISPECIES: IclR family transcriptional regulator [unclassified Sphingomonas]|uniref:IclR family transcriptional regulator n=1 Tax=unclassified Sphingomonas TaxID=196159 RepID=UPI00226AA3EC|nr:MULTISPECIES: IclR family transcriptional regulator [unclassified Sphingomonas]